MSDLSFFSRRAPRRSAAVYLLTLLLGGWFSLSCYRVIPRSSLLCTALERVSGVLPVTAQQLSSWGSAALCAAAALLSLLLFPRLLSDLGELWRGMDRKRFFRALTTFDRPIPRILAMGLADLLLAIFLGTVCMTAVVSLPVTPALEEHMARSAETMEEEGAYPSLHPWCLSKLDNFTDSIMLLEAADDTEDTTLRRAMLMYRGQFIYETELDPCATLIAHYREGEAYTGRATYARYWHGYLLFLKPLLYFLDYSSLRLFNVLVQTALLLVLLWLMKKRGLSFAVIPWLLSAAMLTPSVIGHSLQFSTCYDLMTVGSVLLLAMWNGERREQRTALLFLNLGAATAFFDFLTYPPAVFGMPAVLFLLLRRDSKTEDNLSALIRSGILWCAGYAVMWAGKWLVASALVDKDVLRDALSAASYRVSSLDWGEVTEGTVLGTLLTNYGAFCFTPVTLLLLIRLLRCLRRGGSANVPSELRRVFPLLLTALIPVVWYTVLQNHSSVHFWFTNKDCVVTAFAVLSAAALETAPASTGPSKPEKETA